MRELLKSPKYQKVLFAASKITMEEMVASSNNKSKKKTKLKIGMIQVLQTFGADMKYNPHVHCIVTEDGFDRKWNWIHTYYMPYKFWRRKWQYKLLTMLKKEMPRCRETDVLIHLLFKNNPEGFMINAEHRFEKGEIWNMARYIGRYVKHPPIEPPSVHQLSQQERMQLIIKLIIDNQNGIGASIETVIQTINFK